MTQTAAKSGRVGTNLTEGPIMKTLLIFAIPIVLTNIVQQLYSLVDLIVIGQFVGNAGSIGVNTGGELADLLAPIAMGFSTAGQIYIAQLVGARNEDGAKKAVGTLLTFMLALSIVLGFGGAALCGPILTLLNCPEMGWGQAASYLVITALGTPFVFGYNAVVGILRGMGESKRPLAFILIAAAVGQNLGARKIDRAGKTTLNTFAAATACAAVSAGLCLLFPHQIFNIFSRDTAVIEMGALFLQIFCIHFFASALTGSFQAMVTGCGFVELGFAIGVMDGLVCKIGLSLLFMNVLGLGYIGLWWGVACSRIIPGFICLGYYLSGKWKTRKLLVEGK